MNNCLVCGKKLKKPFYKYCSNKCQSENRYNKYIEKWKMGKASGLRGKSTRNISNHIRRYLLDKYNNKCQLCGWNKINLKTGNVPLEIDHLNGNSEDNTENNLRIICPNCHSLSINYKNLNKGNGRIWRKNKYIKNKI